MGADMVITVRMHTPLLSSGPTLREENRGLSRGSKTLMAQGGLITRRSAEAPLRGQEMFDATSMISLECNHKLQSTIAWPQALSVHSRRLMTIVSTWLQRRMTHRIQRRICDRIIIQLM